MYRNLCRETKLTPTDLHQKWPDYILLMQINQILILNGCQIFTVEELEMELH
jgi:hypothetical protein